MLPSAEVLILDEADRLLDMGFRKHLDDIMQRLPRQRRTGLFSATQTEAVEALSRAGLRNPVRVNVAVSSKSGGGADTRTPATLTSGFLQCREDDKVAVLVAFLRRWGASRKCIVYVLSCASVEFFSIALSELAHHTGGAPVWSLHGKVRSTPARARLRPRSSPTSIDSLQPTPRSAWPLILLSSPPAPLSPVLSASHDAPASADEAAAKRGGS